MSNSVRRVGEEKIRWQILRAWGGCEGQRQFTWLILRTRGDYGGLCSPHGGLGGRGTAGDYGDVYGTVCGRGGTTGDDGN